MDDFTGKTFPTVRISISRVDTTRIQFSTAATAFMIFLNTFIDFSSFVACAVFVFAPLALPQLPTTFAIRAIALLAHVVLPVQYPYISHARLLSGTFTQKVRP